MARKKTHDEFVSEVFELVSDEYSVLGIYKRSHDKIKFKHKVCGKEFSMRPSAFLYGQRCSNCFRPERKTQKEFANEVFQEVGNEYTVKGKYKNYHSKILIKHNKCNNEYKVTPAHFLITKRRCPSCNGGIKRKVYDFEKHVKEYSNGEYEPLTEYKNTKTHVKMKHVVCGHDWNIKPENFFHGKGCPVCNESLGEREIRKYLIKNKMSFQAQYKFDDCRNKRPLPFDFAILNDAEVVSLIEFQGVQHYREIEFFGGKEGFAKTKVNDNIKLQYCKIKKIPLLIIKYNESIDNKLDDFLKYYANPEPSALETV